MSETALVMMWGVAAAALIAGLAVVLPRTAHGAARYRRRIAGTMLLALSLILTTFATTFRFAQN